MLVVAVETNRESNSKLKASPVSGAVAESMDSEAADLEQLVRRYGPRVQRFCIAMTGDQDEALDLAQDVFVVAIERQTSFRGSSSVETWLLGIAVRVCRNWNRRRAIRRRLVVRSKRRRVAVGGLTVAVVAAMFFAVSRSPQPIDTVSRGSVMEVRPQTPVDLGQKAIGSVSEVGSDLELERLVAAAEAAQLYAEEYQAKLNAMKRDRELRIQEAAVAKLIREQARQEYWLSLAKSGE